MRIARKLLITGRVQGVGFRFFAQRSAARHRILGYVRNLADGRVEAHAEGTEDQVIGFARDLAAGPTHSKVTGVEEIVVDPTGLYSSFRIERS
jgi:acylphosphatase